MADRATHVDPQVVHAFWPKLDEATGNLLVEVSYGVPAVSVTLSIGEVLARQLNIKGHRKVRI